MMKKVVLGLLLCFTLFLMLSFFVEKEILITESLYTKTLFGILEKYIEKRETKRLKSLLGLIVDEKEYCNFSIEIEKWDGVREQLLFIENSRLKKSIINRILHRILPVQTVQSKFSLQDGSEVYMKLERHPFSFRTYFAFFLLAGLFATALFYFYELYKMNYQLEDRILDHTRMIKNKETQLELILDNLDSCVIVIGLNGRVQSINVEAEKMLETNRQAVIGETFAKLLKVYDCESNQRIDFEQYLGKVVNSRDLTYSFSRLRFKNNIGGSAFVSLILRLVRNDSLAFHGWICLIRDISEEVKLERQYQQSQKLEAVGQLAGGIAHDFNNLLQVILGYGSLIKNNAQSDEDQEAIEQMLEAGKKAQNLVRKILAFSKVKQEFKAQSVDLNIIVEDSLKMISRILEENIRIIFKPAKGLAAAFCDPEQFEQALINLCVNARDAMPDGGELTIKLYEQRLSDDTSAYEKDFVCCEVSDNGEGIAPEYLDHIFDPFFTTKELGKGTGLGLATVLKIIHQHNGKIQVRSTEGQGTKFVICFPISDFPVEARQTKKVTKAELKGNQETILLAEDQKEVRLLAKKILEKNNYNVVTVNNGVEAVQTFLADPDDFDLLMFDLIMPEKSGWDAAKEILGKHPGIPLMFCSGYSEQVLSDELDFILLEKPYTQVNLLKAIKKLLNQKKPQV
jgi:PAS domain S-box-containing protein